LTLTKSSGAKLLISLCVVVVFLAGSAAAGQGITTGGFGGTVTDAAGAPIGDVLVTLSNATTGVTRLRTTDMNGAFGFSQLAPGEYELLVESLGYQPVRVTNLPIRPGRNLTTTVTIRPANGAVASQEVVRFEGSGLSGTLPQFSQWFPRTQLSGMPHRRRELSELIRLSSSASVLGGVEGLPIRMLGLAVDGMPYRTAASTDAGRSGLIAAVLPLGSFEAGELATNAADVERSGFAAPILNGYSRRGASDWQPAASGQWTASATDDGIDGVEKPTDVQAGFLISGPIVRDSAHLLFGVEYRRYDTPFAAPWAFASAAGDALVSAAQTQNIALQPFLDPGVARTDALTAFARGDWQIADRHRVEVRAVYGTAPRLDAPVQLAQLSTLGNEASASAAAASGALLTELSPTTSNELRLAFTTDVVDAEWVEPFATTRPLPFTSIVDSGLSFGGSAGAASSQRRRQIAISNALTGNMGAHQLKVGAVAELGSVEQTRFFAAQPRAYFGSAANLSALTGLLIQPVGTPATVEFSLSQIAGFLQDTWQPALGLQLVAGVRYEHELLPVSDMQSDAEWLRLTGLSNANAPKSYGKISPRFALTWDPDNQHRWIIAGAAGLYHAEADVNAIAAAIANGRSRVRRQLGAVPSWAAALPTDTAGSARALTLLPAGYRPPASFRASAGLTRVLGAHTAVHATGSYRETRNLPRAVDLNRWPDPLTQDQNGRAIYGVLTQQGALIAADPGSNRRFAGFDGVIGINSDGRSKYNAVTLLLERTDLAGVGFSASYTYSKTTDNWFGARNAGLDQQIAPGIIGTVDEWEDGRSDFDIPHRVAVAADIGGPAGIRLAALYRYESGLPFTPSVATGVDLNGDGYAANDPAFISDQIAGAAAVLGEWSCLNSQVGHFAERNSCRTDAVQSLDLRLTASVLRSPARALLLYAEALNVLQSESGFVDAALYRVDPAGQITTDANGRTVFPLIANTEFGELRERAALPRLLRVGLQFNW
jgi:hypothetical protein